MRLKYLCVRGSVNLMKLINPRLDLMSNSHSSIKAW